MPVPGVPNNPGGENGWQGFGTEQPYGEATKQDALARSVPLAGAAVSAGPIQAPRRASRRAQRGQQAAPAAAPPVVQAATPEPSYAARLATQWQTIAGIPGASPLVQEYAAAAQQGLGA